MGVLGALAAQRVEVGDEMAAHPVDVDELQDPGLLVDLVLASSVGVDVARQRTGS